VVVVVVVVVVAAVAVVVKKLFVQLRNYRLLKQQSVHCSLSLCGSP
jgi:hypothetical protein